MIIYDLIYVSNKNVALFSSILHQTKNYNTPIKRPKRERHASKAIKLRKKFAPKTSGKISEFA